MKRRTVIACSLASMLGMGAVPAALEPQNFRERSDSNSAFESQTFVLVHGAWHGAWCWKYVEQELQGQGHTTHSITLTGLAEKAHLLDAHVGLDTHIQDVVTYVTNKGISDFVLVGHSYGGMVITGVADRISSKIKRLVYLDAVVPGNNDSLISSGSSNDPKKIADMEQSIRDISRDGLTIPVPPLAGLGIPVSDHKNAEWVASLLTPHPLKTWLDRLPFVDTEGMQGLRKTYIHSVNPALESNISVIAARIKKDESWSYVEIDTGHDAMVTKPIELTYLLL